MFSHTPPSIRSRDLLGVLTGVCEPVVCGLRLSTHLVESLDDVQSAMKESAKHRSTFSTNMNDHSSRSHCMLSVQVTSTNKHTAQVRAVTKPSVSVKIK